jgi:membrane associated rhomboid family serine protease
MAAFWHATATRSEQAPPYPKPAQLPSTARAEFFEVMRHQRLGGRRQPPIVNLPPATKAVAAVVILVFLAGFVPILRQLAFTWLYFDPLAAAPGWIAGAASYGLLHGSIMHLVGNVMGLVILGPLVERRDGPAALVMVLLVGAFGGAAAHTAAQLATGDGVALIGASASVAALIGWSLRQIRDRRGFGHLDQAVTIYGLFFIGFNLIGILAFNDGPIAYAAHAGGFVAGWFYGGLAKTPRARF